jgi:glycosyltransferase involved in cell wall biosynthesis
MTLRARVVALVPAYNPGVQALAATLRSLLTQTTPVDVCVIDDGSSPPVEIPQFARSTTKIIRLAQNSGITSALQAGVRFATEGDYEFICRLDVGDLAYPDRVRRQLSHLDEHPEVELVGGFARVVGEDGRTLFFHGVGGGPEAVRAYLWKNAPFRHSSFFMRTQALVAHDGYDPAFDGAEDYELLLRLSKTARIDCLPETVIDYVVDPNGISERRRFRQLRRRLRAQLRHADIADPRWWAGVMRTLLVMATPRRLARWATLWSWGRRSRTHLAPGAARVMTGILRGPDSAFDGRRTWPKAARDDERAGGDADAVAHHQHAAGAPDSQHRHQHDIERQ